tara:strand:+ start:621 stop:854 length:234 start_codon:yes stop_codon:yes gene_type:complete
LSDNPQSEAEEAVAARRYWTLQLARLAGIFTAFAGAMMIVGRWASDGLLGPVLFIGGALLFFAVPILLAKKWKSEKR